MPRILITGCSSGFGQAIAAQFLDQGWEVVATMRNPSVERLTSSDRLQVLPLDVTNPNSIATAVASAGQIDALVNNAGVGMLNVLEGAEIARARAVRDQRSGCDGHDPRRDAGYARTAKRRNR